MKHRLLLTLLSFALISRAQTPLSEGQLNLTGKLSEAVLGNTAKELPEILISAFRQGKLKAYRFGYQKQPVYGELEQWPNPKEWSTKSIYDKGDSVYYKGKLYRYMFQRNDPGVIQLGGLTPDIAPDAHGINDYWQQYKRMPPVIGMNYNLPTEKDILKAENWEDVKAKATPPIEYWNPNKDYFPNDIVTYEGKTYESMSNNVKSKPTNQNDWALTYRGVSDDAFTELQFVYNSESFLPIAFQLSLEANSEVCIGFYVEAVKQYLIAAKQQELADKLELLMREKKH